MNHILTLVKVVEQRDKDGKAVPEIELVLQIGGMMVMGILVSERVFIENSKGTIKAAAHSYEEAVSEAIVESNFSLDDISGGEPQFIHLKNAEFQIPGGNSSPPNSTELWRGRINAIDGFCLGHSL